MRERLRFTIHVSSEILPDTYFLNQSTENGEIFFGDFQIINWKSSWKYTTLRDGEKFSHYDNWQMNNKQKEELPLDEWVENVDQTMRERKSEWTQKPHYLQHENVNKKNCIMENQKFPEKMNQFKRKVEQTQTHTQKPANTQI